MKMVAKIFIYLTLWCDLCLITGVYFTGNYGGAKVMAQITVGSCSIDSRTHDGALFIMMVAVWTGVLALGGLLGLRKIRLQDAA
jgi:hypothetical protein